MKLLKKLKEKEGVAYIDVAILVISSMLVLMLIISVIPVFIVKDQLNTFSKQLLREAQLQGKINISHTSIEERLEIDVDKVEWHGNSIGSNKIQFNEEIRVTCSKEVDIGFSDFGSFKINLISKAGGRSEVYWKE